MIVTSALAAENQPLWEWVVELHLVNHIGQPALGPYAVITRATDSRQAVANVMLGVVLENDEHIERIGVNRLQVLAFDAGISVGR